MTAANSEELKKLGFVPQVSTQAYNTLGSVYTTAKTYVPASLKPQVERVEETVTSISAPYIAKAQDKGTELLKAVDDRVDKTLSQAQAVYANNSAYLSAQLEKQKAFHASNLESYKTAREAYLKKVEESVEYLKANGLSGAARKAADEVSARVAQAQALPAAVLSGVRDAVDRLLAHGPLASVVEGVRPGLDAAYSRYLALHDAAVASPQYRRTLELGASALATAQASLLYRKAKENLYPLVAPYADPALNSVMASSYYKAVVDHLAPKTIAA